MIAGDDFFFTVIEIILKLKKIKNFLFVFLFVCNKKILSFYFPRLCTTRREFSREILYKNIAIIAIQHSKIYLLTPLAIFPILLSENHSSPSGKFSDTY